MKSKLKFFLAKHSFFGWLLISIIVCGIYTGCLAFIGAEPWKYVLLNLLGVFCSYMIVLSTPGSIMRPAINALLNDCNPYPLYEATTELLKYKLNKSNANVAKINYGASLLGLGRADDAIDALLELNEEEKSLTLGAKLAYYINVSNGYFQLNDFEKASLFYHKAVELTRGIKSKGTRARFDTVLEAARLEELYRNGQYNELLRSASQISATTKNKQVTIDYMSALAYIKLENYVLAKSYLREVIKNANLFKEKALAQEFLNKLENDDM